MSFPAYPAYKDSGVEWLGEVPQHWTVQPLKRAIAKIESGTSVNAVDYPAEPGSYGVLKTSCVYTGQFDWRENKTVDEEDLNRVSCPLNINTLVVSRMNTPDLVGATGLVVEAPIGIFLPDRLWQIYFEKNQSASFIFYFTKAPEYRGQVKNACSGTSSSMQNLGQDDFRNLLFVQPSVVEQTQIARFLDHETARIDALIEEQQRLIELLKEKRQAVISHAVTKGLDPTVPMKDSGVEWLGEVPCSWRVIKFGITHDKAELGGNYEAGESEEGLPLIKMGNIGRGKIKLDKVEYVSLNQDIDNGHTLKEGDFLFNTRNSLDLVGKVCVWRSELQVALYNSNILRISFNKSLVGSSGFVNYLLNSNLGLEQLRLIARGTTSVAAIYYKDLSSLSFAFPPPSEQREIERFLDIQTSQLDALVSVAEQTVDVIKERRSALISAAVTGKIDVRGWQPPASAPIP